MRIGVLLTCHNRRQKTVTCLQSLLRATKAYNGNHNSKLEIEIFLTDDGCSDGTSEAVRSVIPSPIMLHILKGNGSLYWAGGMRVCWNEALKQHAEWDYYLLLNDDVELMECVFDELFEAELYAVDHFGKAGLVCGITCDKNDESKMTYGGKVWVNKFLGTTRHLPPKGVPQKCVLANANIMLVLKAVVDDIGIFYDGYTHACADSDYSYMATKAGYPVMLTSGFCGRCEADHGSFKEMANKVIKMTLKERCAFFRNPLHSNRDYLRFELRVTPFRLPLVCVGRLMNLFFPRVYYFINRIR